MRWWRTGRTWKWEPERWDEQMVIRVRGVLQKTQDDAHDGDEDVNPEFARWLTLAEERHVTQESSHGNLHGRWTMRLPPSRCWIRKVWSERTRRRDSNPLFQEPTNQWHLEASTLNTISAYTLLVWMDFSPNYVSSQLLKAHNSTITHIRVNIQKLVGCNNHHTANDGE